jgi:hypothetical protein
MMKLILLILSISLLGGAFTACKKGENDPFMSLRSRKARLAGEWKVTSSENVLITTENGNGITSVKTSISTYNGTAGTTTSNSKFTSSTGTSESSNITSSDYTLNYIFEKDGTYTFKYFDSESGESDIEEGFWSFMSKNKGADLKNKEAITLTQTKISDSDGYAMNIKGKINYGDILIIDQLKNKEVIFKYDYTGSYSYGTTSDRGTVTMKAK